MKTKIYLSVVLAAAILIPANAQTNSNYTIDSLQHFDKTDWITYLNQFNPTASEQAEFIAAQKKQYIKDTYYPSNKDYTGSNQIQQACTNIDFESGTTTGWTKSTGFHPLFNTTGCCPTLGGAQTIMSGAGLDACGGFPVVAPGGSFSLLLGNSQTGGIADRIEQTFAVTTSNANFTYKYAVVFQDPGHTVSQQPAFQIEMLDSNKVQIPCTYYNVAAGQNIPGFQTSSCAGVIFKPWSSVVVDLTAYIGQNVTIRFSTYDCALGGHYGYAYIDGSCMQFQMATSDTICVGGSKNICAPVGFGSYVWNGPSLTNFNGQCATVSAAGIYSVQTTLVTGCTGPVFTYSIYNYAQPFASFITTNSTCSPTVSFSNSSSISSGVISSYAWKFGDGGTSTLMNPTHVYAPSVSYTPSLTVTSNHGCFDTTMQMVIVNPLPLVAFSAPVICQNASFNFSNTSSIPTGNITNWNWSFGDASANSNAQTPSHTYANAGNYIVNLTATSAFGCSNSNTVLVTVNPTPNVTFSTTSVCFGNATAFFNNSTISSGNISGWAWDFTNDGITDAVSQNPVYTFTAAGSFSVSLSALSNVGCLNTYSTTLDVYPLPVVALVGNNVCNGTSTTFSNQTTISGNNTITNYYWNFGNGTVSNQANPSPLYTGPGNYVVNLMAVSNHNCVSQNSITVSVFPVPSVNFTTTTACLNQATQFNNTTIVSSGTIIKWRWDFENNGSWDDSTAAPSHVYPSFGGFSSKLYALSNNNCWSQKINPVVVHGNPVANFKAPSTCLGDNTAMTNLSSCADGSIISYQWDFNGDNVIDNVTQNPTASYSNYGVFLCKLEVQSQYGCTNVMSKSVYVNPKPMVNFAAQNKIGCPSLCTVFSNSCSIAKGNIVTYQWNFGDGSLPDYSKNPTHCYSTGNYGVNLKVVSDSGCMNSIGYPNLVTVYPQPVAGFVATPDEIDLDQPLISVSNTATNYTSLTYYINDGATYTVPNFQHSFNVEASTKLLIYQLVKNSYGCSDSAFKVIDIKPSYVIYIPNAFTPNADGLNDGFGAKGVGIEKFEMQIYDRWGHVIFQTDDITKTWDGTVKGTDEAIKDDVYVWKAQVQDVFHKNHDLVGHVTLLK